MDLTLECVPCLMRQTLEATRLATADPRQHERILREVAARMSSMAWSLPPPRFAADVHGLIREVTGNADPYREVKRRCNRVALELLPELRQRVHASLQPLRTAVRVAIAGNVVDFAAPGGAKDFDRATVERVLEQPLAIDHEERLLQQARTAERILFLGDNAGEIVFDRPLLELLGPERVVYVVRGGPISNDATMEDARETGLTELVEVIPSGVALPGTVPEASTPRVRRLFERADLVISKGQGNFETLSAQRRPGLFFLLRVKCPVHVKGLGVELGSIAVIDASRR